MKSTCILSDTARGLYTAYLKDSSYYQAGDLNNLGLKYTATRFEAADRNYGFKTGSSGQLANLGTELGAEFTLSLVSAEIAYCDDNQTNMYAGLFIRRNLVASGTEAGRVTILPSSNPTFAIWIDATADNVATRARIPGGVSTFTGIHEGQSDVVINTGDIVIDSSVLFKENVSNVFSKVVVSTNPKDKRVFGIVADVQRNVEIISEVTETPVQNLFGETAPVPNTDRLLAPWELEYTVFVNAVGEGQVNVCGENGNIEAGDLIVSSSMPGKGMKQDDDLIRSYTVAKARESVTFDSPTQVKMIACTYLCG